MKIGIFISNTSLEDDERYLQLSKELILEGCTLYRVHRQRDLQKDTDIILCLGGDGTFLKSAAVVGDSAVPILGVNLGRLGFLSESIPSDMARCISNADFVMEERSLLALQFSAGIGEASIAEFPFALNEVTVHRSSGAILGVDVSIDGAQLPTYWSDGLLVATSTGSTAYSLSVGGPIVMPESKVLIVSPISPHNLNVRPLIVPDTAQIELSFQSRDTSLMLTVDNRSVEIDTNTKIKISLAQFSLKRLRLNSSNFIKALTSKLFWGEDIRNN